MSETSLEAYFQIFPKLHRLQWLVYDLIANSPNGLTQLEAEEVLAMKHQTVSPRFWELERMGVIKRTRQAVVGNRYIWVYEKT